MTHLSPGKRTADHHYVGLRFRERGTGSRAPLSGVCVSVTPWGSQQIRWIRLLLDDGTEKSFAPSHLRIVPRA